MLSLHKFIRLVLFTGCLFTVGVSCTQAEQDKKTTTAAPDMNAMMGMMNPAMYMNMMNPMMAPAMGMMNPMMGMNMMYPMMGMMNPSMMMNPMGTMGMPGMGMHGGNPMGQMPGGQMMDPKQYEQWFSQWTEMMKNMTPQTQQTK